MGEVLDKKEIHPAGNVKVYKQSRMAYFFYYLIVLGFLALAVFTRLNKAFNIVCFVLFVIFLLYLEIIIAKNQLIVDDTKATIRIGILNIVTKSVPIRMISDMRVKQNFLQSIFHFGTLEINTGGGEFYELKMEKLKNPVKVQERIEERLHKIH